MKKNPKQIVAIISLILIAILIIAFFISAIFTDGSSNLFFILLGLIIAVPIFAWIILFCYGRFANKHTMAELFPEGNADANANIAKNPDNADFSDEEITGAMEEAKNSSNKI